MCEIIAKTNNKAGRTKTHATQTKIYTLFIGIFIKIWPQIPMTAILISPSTQSRQKITMSALTRLRFSSLLISWLNNAQTVDLSIEMPSLDFAYEATKKMVGYNICAHLQPVNTKLTRGPNSNGFVSIMAPS